MDARSRILVKKAEMAALSRAYSRAMRAGELAIEKIAAHELARKERIRRAYAAVTGLGR